MFQLTDFISTLQTLSMSSLNTSNHLFLGVGVFYFYFRKKIVSFLLVHYPVTHCAAVTTTITMPLYHLSISGASESAEASHIAVISRTLFDLSTHELGARGVTKT